MAFRRLVESLLDAKVWPFGQQAAVTLQKIPAVFYTSTGHFQEKKDKHVSSGKVKKEVDLIGLFSLLEVFWNLRVSVGMCLSSRGHYEKRKEKNGQQISGIKNDIQHPMCR